MSEYLERLHLGSHYLIAHDRYVADMSWDRFMPYKHKPGIYDVELPIVMDTGQSKNDLVSIALERLDMHAKHNEERYRLSNFCVPCKAPEGQWLFPTVLYQCHAPIVEKPLYSALEQRPIPELIVNMPRYDSWAKNAKGDYSTNSVRFIDYLLNRSWMSRAYAVKEFTPGISPVVVRTDVNARLAFAACTAYRIPDEAKHITDSWSMWVGLGLDEDMALLLACCFDRNGIMSR